MRNRGVVMRWGTSIAASALFATLLVAVGVAVRVEAPMTRSAGVTDLCSGWSGCVSAGYSDAGYGAVSNRMYWNMYSGHNCTNYVAYRMIKAGMPATRPWVGGGNASEWGLQMKSITDQVPAVGSVAWWGRYSNGSGSAGHVGYVEKVVSPTEIIISMDSWGGTFHWRRITKDSGRWPTGFIHFVDKALLPKGAPVVTGDAVVGGTLKATAGKWSATPSAYAYEWFADGVTTGVRTATFVPRAADLAKAITVKVSATRAGYRGGAQVSAATTAVLRGSFEPGDAPTVTGQPLVDEVLTATAGTWSPQPRSVEWRWYADNQRLAGQTGPTLGLTSDLVGKEVSAAPVVRQAGYLTTLGQRVVAGKVLVGTIELTEPFSVTGIRSYGETLTVHDGVSTPADATRSYQWLRDGVPISGATRSTYKMTAADVAHRMSVQVNLTRKNYAPLSADLPTTGVVRSPATIRIATASADGKAAVRVHVVAPGVDPVSGLVRIRIGSFYDTVRLVDGRAKVVVERRPGVKVVGVRYLGSPVVRTVLASSSVRVR